MSGLLSWLVLHDGCERSPLGVERAAPERANDTGSGTSTRCFCRRLLSDDIVSDNVDDRERVQQRILSLEVAVGASLHSLGATTRALMATLNALSAVFGG